MNPYQSRNEAVVSVFSDIFWGAVIGTGLSGVGVGLARPDLLLLLCGITAAVAAGWMLWRTGE